MSGKCRYQLLSSWYWCRRTDSPTAVLKIFVGGTTLDTSGIAKKAAVRRQASCSRLGRQSLMPGSLLIGHENM